MRVRNPLHTRQQDHTARRGAGRGGKLGAGLGRAAREAAARGRRRPRGASRARAEGARGAAGHVRPPVTQAGRGGSRRGWQTALRLLLSCGPSRGRGYLRG